MRRSARAALGGVLLGASALGALGCERHDAAPGARATAAAPVAVGVETATPTVVPEALEAVGTVRSWKQSVLSSKIVAAVVAVHVREGQVVEPGQVVVELDDRDVRAQLARAHAALREAQSGLEEVDRSIDGAERAVEGALAQEQLARITHDRMRQLVERELIARQDHDEAAARLRVATAESAGAREAKAALQARRRQAQARIEQARAEVDNARVMAGHARLVAPGTGVVAARTVEVGNLAAPGVPLLTFEEERYRLEVTVNESDIARLRLGQRADVAVEAAGVAMAGAITEIVPAADPLSRTFLVKIDLPRARGLRSGVYGRATFAVGERRALLVPRTAVSTQGQVEGVYVVGTGDVARLRLVKTGKGRGDRVEILSGLADGERLVTEAARVADGQAVAVR
jgi:multidrug efflux pump subunit AcrA (membrane-fusion protein)